ncbi:pentapeptide repeat-containing protein [Streptomyces alanosinicus]|uniref:pentapeptide repeat-containing protein n=1 Tax=Streptomyces alanosinicus TaxID=68171 RepID=UPI001676D872|nr:pentapeptide repeat-containing protein [Streptomyces alanosinicus]
MSEEARLSFLTSLSYGQDVDFSGTTFTSELLNQLLQFMRDPEAERAGFGSAKFSGATFIGPANFDSVDFLRDATFLRVKFHEDAHFAGAIFHKGAQFAESEIEGDGRFERAKFLGLANFSNASFRKATSFADCTFADAAEYRSARFYTASFMRAKFRDRCTFTGSTFSGRKSRFSHTEFFRTADFSASSFQRGVQFLAAQFHSAAKFTDSSITSGTFTGVTFAREVDFENVTFGRGGFNDTTFSDDAIFSKAQFNDRAHFANALFRKAALFRDSRFNQGAHFVGAIFERAKHIGPIVSEKSIIFNGASFGSPLIIEASAAHLGFQQTEWSSTGVLRVRYASVNLSGATFAAPMIVATMPTFFLYSDGGALDDSRIGESVPAKITSLQGADVSRLLLVDVDLRECRFAGAMHLDQIRLEGECQFSNSPRGIHIDGWRIARWSQRRVLAEEAEWRAGRPWPSGWRAPSATTSVTPAALSATYRHLRKSFEDSKNEPDAADFYYGEMEMRRNDSNRPHSERYLLALYCLVSGYGLRAGRALLWFGVTIVATLVAMVFWGLPSQAPTAVSSGVISGHNFQEVTNVPKPVNPTGSLSSRATSQRFEKGLRVVVNSVVFRSSGQVLTTSGTYIEMVSRAIEPVFLGLALLAMRSRLKR